MFAMDGRWRWCPFLFSDVFEENGMIEACETLRKRLVVLSLLRAAPRLVAKLDDIEKRRASA